MAEMDQSDMAEFFNFDQAAIPEDGLIPETDESFDPTKISHKPSCAVHLGEEYGYHFPP